MSASPSHDPTNSIPDAGDGADALSKASITRYSPQLRAKANRWFESYEKAAGGSISWAVDCLAEKGFRGSLSEVRQEAHVILYEKIIPQVYLRLQRGELSDLGSGYAARMAYSATILACRRLRCRLETQNVDPRLLTELAVSDNARDSYFSLYLEYLSAALRELDEGERLLLKRKYEERLSAKQIAELESVTDRAINKRLEKLRGKLKRSLHRMAHPEGSVEGNPHE